ncbi:hypothetical protein Asal01_02143 [Fodinibius salicampi]
MGLIYMALWIASIIGIITIFNNPENIVGSFWIFPGGALGILLLVDLLTIPKQIREVKQEEKQ